MRGETMVDNAVIVYLTRKNDLWSLQHSIRYLYKNFNSEAQYPVVVFHDDLTAVDIANFLSQSAIQIGHLPKIKFERLSFDVPVGVSTDPSLYNPPLTQFRIGYRHMCRFFGGLVFDHHAMSKYRWYWRLDSDSFILSKVTRDPFEEMERKGYCHGHIEAAEKDSPWACEGFWESTQEFMEANKDLLVNHVPSWDYSVYNTNFELLDMEFFRSQRFRDYFKHIDATNNIYYRRWGDHCIHYLALMMFAKPETIWGVDYFCYQHGGDVKNIKHIDMSCVETVPEPFKSATVRHLSAVAK